MKTYVAILLDESGSMNKVKSATVRSFNEQVRAIRESVTPDNEVLVSLVAFGGDSHRDIFWNAPVSDLRELLAGDYSPFGGTPMLDAVGSTIERLQQDLAGDVISNYNAVVSGQSDTAVLVVIISDGEENNSHSFTYEKVAEKIQDLQSTGHWTFTYVGSNQDLSKISEQMHIPLANTLLYNASNTRGVDNMTADHSRGLGTYMSLRSSGMTSMATFYDQNHTNDEESQG